MVLRRKPAATPRAMPFVPWP